MQQQGTKSYGVRSSTGTWQQDAFAGETEGSRPTRVTEVWRWQVRPFLGSDSS